MQRVINSREGDVEKTIDSQTKPKKKECKRNGRKQETLRADRPGRPTRRNIKCVRQSPGRNNKQSCFYNYSPDGTPGVKSTQVHAVPVSGGMIDRSKNKRVVRGMFRAAPQTQQPWPSPDGQPAGKCDANASGSAVGGSWQFPNLPKHTSRGNKKDQWARE